jgi:hypothetical protein
MNGATRLAVLLGTWGKPVETPARVALGLGALLVIVAFLPRRLLVALGIADPLAGTTEHRKRLVLVLAFAAAFLSLGYVAFYLRGGPRIIDATTYYLEGRMLSHGELAWPIPSPSASFRGRFLLLSGADSLAGIFPPGYPLLLAAGFRVGAPLVIGPLLAGALVIATYWLARELSGEQDSRRAHAIGCLAATLSLVCAALRYHTADTMSHGASALGITLALIAALRAARSKLPWMWGLAGLIAGWVVCTRPVSSVPITLVVMALAWRTSRQRAVGRVLLGLFPGVVGLLVASRAQTGHWLTSAQAAYYQVSDGPPGCFRYGFGAGVGCLEEHKDFVLSRLPHGFGFVPALLTTLRRLRVHLLDVANLEPLALLVLVPLRRSLRARAAAPLALVLGQILSYVPFYFDGDYPGGGARFFADVLPVEHVLLAMAVASMATHISFTRRSVLLIGLACAGFGAHAAFEHDALAAREDGRPMYESEIAHDAGKGILFFDTDHGFNLAYNAAANPAKELLAARFRGDDHDRLLVERMGRPQAHLYKMGPKGAILATWNPPPGTTSDLWHFEAEADWPPLAQHDGWVEPIWAAGTCAAAGRALTLHTAGIEASASLAVPVPRTGKWLVTPRVMRRGGPGRGTLRLLSHGRSAMPEDAKLVWDWADSDAGARPGKDLCVDLPAKEVFLGADLDQSGAEWVLTATGGDVTLDQTSLRATR